MNRFLEEKPRDDATKRRWVDRLFLLGVFSACIPLVAFAYLGNFSRYLADDYCASAFLMLPHKNIFQITWDAYQTWFNSYSRLIFVQLFDWGGTWGIRVFPTITLVAWVPLLAWFVSGLVRSLIPRGPTVLYVWCASLLIFLSLYQSPALYQVFYWRTGLIPYTLPLVLFVAIAAIMVWYIEKPYEQFRGRWMIAVVLFMVLVAGGLSETTSAMQVGLWFCTCLFAWFTNKSHKRRDILIIVTASLVCAVLALLITAASPGTSNRLDRIMTNSPQYNPIYLSSSVLHYTVQFLWDTTKSFPLLIAVALLLPFTGMFLWLLNDGEAMENTPTSLRWALLFVPVIVIIVIGFSFAPSAFVLHYPVARARFASHFLMMLGLGLEGGILGILASQNLPRAAMKWVGMLSVILLVGTLVHPLRATPSILSLRAEFEKFANAWDARDRFIQQSVSAGATELEVIQLDSIGGIGEYKGNPRHWINKCAADFYGLDSIIAP